LNQNIEISSYVLVAVPSSPRLACAWPSRQECAHRCRGNGDSCFLRPEPRVFLRSVVPNSQPKSKISLHYSRSFRRCTEALFSLEKMVSLQQSQRPWVVVIAGPFHHVPCCEWDPYFEGEPTPGPVTWRTRTDLYITL
jgi:hypothetical protein